MHCRRTLLLTAIGIDALGIRRGLKAEYFILTDPLIIIAGAVLLDRMNDLRLRKWAYPIGAALLVLHVAVSQAEPVKFVLKREGPEGYCQWRPYYMPLMPLPHWQHAGQTRMTASVESPAGRAHQKPQRDALARLTPFGWNGGLTFILALLSASFFFAGYFIIYWRNADMDFMIVYNALVMNDGKPQAFFDHPSYFTILSVKWWFQAMHALGLLDAWKLSSIPSALNVPAFDAAMTEAVRAGRIVAWLTATLLVAIFAALSRRLFSDWRIALLATFAFAFSGGMAVEMRILRSEMIAASFFIFALMILIIAGRCATIWRPLALAAAAALCVLGMENKIQIILPIAALSFLILPFGASTGASGAFWNKSARAWAVVLFAGAASVFFGWLALPLLAAGMDSAATAEATIRPLIGGRFGLYQIALLGWIAVCMIAYAAIWRISVTRRWPRCLLSSQAPHSGCSRSIFSTTSRTSSRSSIRSRRC